ncbi:MAG: HD domain-containing protein [Nitrospirae bacterium]|nr:HD domain-containing protein [Nitrospirota bacterium]
MTAKDPTELISHLVTSLSNCSLYSERHPLVDAFAQKALELMEGFYSDNLISLTLLGDSLVANDNPVKETGTHIDSFKKRMRKKGIEKIVIRKGVDLEELKQFIARAVSGERVLSSPHVSVGMVEVKFKAEGVDISDLVNENITKVREIYQGVAKFRRLEVVSLEDAVAGFISTLKREMNVLRIISPVKSYSGYTYVHATNVSVLTMFQAEALGIQGESLHDLGLAALLHDVGKLFVPKGVLEKTEKLSETEWDAIKRHPVLGARYLATLPDAPKLSVIAAFEHHMKFNGNGYPDTKRRGKRQHIASQMVAIADFFDALRTERSYRRALDIGPTVEFMKAAAGRDFNPLLVDNFVGALKRIKAI